MWGGESSAFNIYQCDLFQTLQNDICDFDQLVVVMILGILRVKWQTNWILLQLSIGLYEMNRDLSRDRFSRDLSTVPRIVLKPTVAQKYKRLCEANVPLTASSGR